MKMLGFEQFMDDFGRAAKNTMNLSVYRDNFKCACGQNHWFDESIDVVCQGGLMKLMVVCPKDPSYLTSVKVKTFLIVKFKGFESLAGTKIANATDAEVFAGIRRLMR